MIFIYNIFSSLVLVCITAGEFAFRPTEYLCTSTTGIWNWNDFRVGCCIIRSKNRKPFLIRLIEWKELTEPEKSGCETNGHIWSVTSGNEHRILVIFTDQSGSQHHKNWSMLTPKFWLTERWRSHLIVTVFYYWRWPLFNNVSIVLAETRHNQQRQLPQQQQSSGVFTFYTLATTLIWPVINKNLWIFILPEVLSSFPLVLSSMFTQYCHWHVLQKFTLKNKTVRLYASQFLPAHLSKSYCIYAKTMLM